MEHWLSLVIGLLAFAVAKFADRILERRTIPRQHAGIQREVIELLNAHVQHSGDLMQIEQRLFELSRATPSDRQGIWIAESVASVRRLPPVLVDLARKFGFRVPNHDVAQSDEIPEATAPVVIEPDGWPDE